MDRRKTVTREELIKKVAKALIDVDPCVEGYHESHIRLKTPDAKAAIAIVLEEAAKVCGNADLDWEKTHEDDYEGPDWWSGFGHACDYCVAAIRALGNDGE